MTLFRRAVPEAATNAAAFQYCGPDGQVRELTYEELPTELGRWTYTTRTDPSFFFAFDLEQAGRVVRLYIAEQPPYGARPDGLLVTHRLADGDRRFICIRAGYEPVEGREAATWIVMWSEATAQYILTGKNFS